MPPFLLCHAAPHVVHAASCFVFQGGGGVIKAGDTLLFDVELLGFHEKAKERWEMSAAELMEEATKTKVLRTLHTFRSVLFSTGRLIDM